MWEETGAEVVGTGRDEDRSGGDKVGTGIVFTGTVRMGFNFCPRADL